MVANASRIDTTKVDTQFLQDVLDVLAAQPDLFYITCGNRDGQTELAGYEKFLADPVNNPRYTNPSISAHVGANFPDGRSRAVDVTLVRDGKDIWEDDANAKDPKDPGWVALLAAIKAHPRLHSLVSWGDYDHIEKVDWRADKAPATPGAA